MRSFGRTAAEAAAVRAPAPGTVPGEAPGDGGRPTSTEAAALLAPLVPYRGLAAFYLLVAARC